jgi:hypothetical protein
MLAAMAYCPGCGTVIAKDAASCPSCMSTFGGDGARKPLDAPPPPANVSAQAPRWLHVVTRTAIALVSLAFLGAAAAIAEAGRNGTGWRNACFFAMLGVVIVAVSMRTRWSFVVLFAAVALGFTSCANTFHWQGG